MASSAELCRQPGAVIESFVNHSPGLFSGTFSGKSHTGVELAKNYKITARNNRNILLN